MSGYIYVIWLREFKNTGESVYKVGRTQDVLRRVSQYPKGSELLFSVRTSNVHTSETELLRMLGDNFVMRQDIGREYFEGDVTRLLTLVWEKMQNDGALPTSSVLTRNASSAGSAPVPVSADPMRSVSDFVHTRREELSTRTEKGLDLFERYLKTDGAVQQSFKKFTTTLKQMYGVRVEPMRFADGVHLGIVFPELLAKKAGTDENCQIHNSNDLDLVLQFVENLWRGQIKDYHIYTASDMLKRFHSFVEEELQIDADTMRHWNAQKFGRRLNRMVNESRGGLKKQINYGKSRVTAYALCEDKMKRYLEKQGVVLTEDTDMQQVHSNMPIL